MMWAQSKLWANIQRVGVPHCPNCNNSLLLIVKKEKKVLVRVFPLKESETNSGIKNSGSKA